jgi:putative membrane protein
MRGYDRAMAGVGVSSRSPSGFIVWLLITVSINVLALIVVNWLFSSVVIRGFWSYALGALALGLGNAFLKPILALLTLPLIIITLGLAYFALNVAMLALAEWIAPHFSIDGFWTYVGATIVVWLLNVAMRGLVDTLSGSRSKHADS